MNGRGLGRALVVTTITAIVCVILMSFYVTNKLDGDLDNHVLSSRLFGAPKALLDHGFKLFYQGDRETGWDGQFYYYIANDPLAQKDTAAHIDATAYRYQRVGLPLLAWAVSRLTGHDWVSPTSYYLTDLAIVLLATLIGGLYFARRGYGAWPVLAWSLSLGVQLTLLNGLPDAAADALLLIALVAHFSGFRWFFALFATLAALSREAYVLFPILVAAFDWGTFIGFSRTIVGDRTRRSIALRQSLIWAVRRGWIIAIPVALFGLWQVYLRLKFHIAPSAQAHGILGAPLQSWFQYVATSLAGSHPLFAPGWTTTRELIALVIFVPLLLIGIVVPSVAWKRSSRTDPVRPIAAATFGLTILYACFGPTVMMHYTGYMKAAGLFFLIVPFLWGSLKRATRLTLLLFLLATNAYFGFYLYQDRIASAGVDYERYLHVAQVINKTPIPCLKSFDSQIRLVGIEDLNHQTVLSELAPRAVAFRVEVTDPTQVPFVSTTGAGSIHVSYHWLSADGNSVVKDGIRTMLPDPIPPGGSKIVPIVVEYPTAPGHYILRLTLVQEGCAWFYNANPNSKLDIDYVVR